MSRLNKDIPKFIIEMLDSVDYTQITDEHYDGWIKIIRDNIGKHLKERTKPVSLVEYKFPIREDFCALINHYDFGSLSLMKQATIIPLAKKWANENLPLKHSQRAV